ncbi:enoyl-CoA hydratase [Alteribacillus iranensis]|uniref:Enoyl-CoA hydratase n=1 Tax=Alteribacillus iranensis TaxID=930128 RepID=A0A1I2BBG6_9BACI|nr:enoyl-CoA hydratase [Alteribacillus iranensis]SFE53501.1 enoyl-CoA hydratase [Alteribacillus iranensis]
MAQANAVNFEKIKVEVEESYAIVYINNPPANALNTETIRELSSCIDHLASQENVKAILLTGEGKFFIAGADIKEFQDGFNKAEVGKTMAEEAQAVFQKIENLSIPVIAAINGACLGGGLELAMSCHMRIASHEAVIGQPELNLGLIPGFGGTQRLPRLTNKAKALELILLSKNVKGEEAEKLGIVNKSVDKEDVLQEARQWAETIATQKSASSVAATLKAVTNGLNNGLTEGLQEEAHLFGGLFETEDMQEGVTAFIEKRKPVFKDT